MSITYNRYLLNISNIVTKNWSILQISLTLQKVFDKKSMITFKRNKKLGELVGGHTLQGGKIFKTHLQIIKAVKQNHATQPINHLYVVHK